MNGLEGTARDIELKPWAILRRGFGLDEQALVRSKGTGFATVRIPADPLGFVGPDGLHRTSLERAGRALSSLSAVPLLKRSPVSTVYSNPQLTETQ